MKNEDFNEYHRYYDFSKELLALKQGMQIVEDDGTPLKEGETYYEYESGDDSDSGNEWESIDEEDEDDEEDEEWEEEGEATGEAKKKEDATDETEEEKEEGEGTEKKKKKEKRIHRFKVRKIRVLDNGEIQLPSGVILGHRKYKELYHQYLREGIRDSTKKMYLEYSGERSLALFNKE